MPSCTICLGAESGDRCVLRCGHVFHFSCIDKWFAHNASQRHECPVCRQPLLHRPMYGLAELPLAAAAGPETRVPPVEETRGRLLKRRADREAIDANIEALLREEAELAGELRRAPAEREARRIAMRAAMWRPDLSQAARDRPLPSLPGHSGDRDVAYQQRKTIEAWDGLVRAQARINALQAKIANFRKVRDHHLQSARAKAGKLAALRTAAVEPSPVRAAPMHGP